MSGHGLTRGEDLVLGIDEAGRGPLLGPLVIACVGVRPAGAARLSRAGVADSKRFGAGAAGQVARAALVPLIRRHAAHVAIVVSDVAEVDRRTRRGELNRLEQEQAAGLLRGAPPFRRAIADGANLFKPLVARFPGLLALDRAEARHVAVAAASILAKVRRDELLALIARRYEADYGPLAGGGYVNPPTRDFVRRYIRAHGAPPPEARRSWPWDFARDLLPPGFDRSGADAAPGQLALL